MRRQLPPIPKPRRRPQARGFAAVGIAVAVSIFVDQFGGNDALILIGPEDRDALRRASRDRDSFHRAPDQLAAICHQHDLIGILNRERRDEAAIAVIHSHRDDAFAAPSRSPVFVGRGSFSEAPLRHRQHMLLRSAHFAVTGGAEIGDIGAFDRLAVVQAASTARSAISASIRGCPFARGGAAHRIRLFEIGGALGRRRIHMAKYGQ